MTVRYENLCSCSAETLRRVFEHCGFGMGDALISEYAERLRLPDYYNRDLSDADLQIIAEETDNTASRFGFVTR